MKRLLMIAFHFPPLAGSSGIQRTLRFVQQLPSYGWQPIVLTVQAGAYERTSPDLDAQVPTSVVVRRAFALDAARQLAIGGRYPGMLARPDRWMSWRLDGLRQGMRLVREFKPDALWSTYPIATAHVIGADLQRRTGLPWVADFRDPMAQPDYPEDPKTKQAFGAIEQRASRQAQRLCFTTPSSAETYRLRYPDAANRMTVLENGFDEESFRVAETAPDHRTALNPGRKTLLHSGTVYLAERDPTHLLAALAYLKSARPNLAQDLQVRFRAPVHQDQLRSLAASHGVTDLIEVLPPIGYAEALVEMLRADGLLVLQASNCNEQVPAKIYEYLRAGQPIVCLSDPKGDTCAVLRGAGVTRHGRLDSAPEIAEILGRFLAADVAGLVPLRASVSAASRAARTAQLAELLNECATRKSVGGAH